MGKVDAKGAHVTHGYQRERNLRQGNKIHIEPHRSGRIPLVIDIISGVGGSHSSATVCASRKQVIDAIVAHLKTRLTYHYIKTA